jgi:Flp pilus assembly CpaE family ATPase
MGETSQLHLVSTSDVTSLSEAKRILRKLSEVAYYPGHIRLILNRASKTELDVPELEKTFGMPISAFLPQASRERHEAYAGGKLLPDSSLLCRQINRIAGELTGLGVEPAKPGGLFAIALQGLRLRV